MTPNQKLLVQSSFTQLQAVSQSVAAEFYDRLFELDPSLRPLFKNNIEEQGRKLMEMLRLVVNNLDRLDEILSTVQGSGSRHVSYGTKAHDYETVGNALLWVLRKRLGTAFTKEVEEAWVIAYNTLARLMIAA